MHCWFRRLLLALFAASALLSTAAAQAAAPVVATPAAAPAQAVSDDPKVVLERGKTLFGQDKYREALDAFGQVLADPRATVERPEAAYWSVLAYLGVGDQSSAAAAIDAFLAAYPSNPRIPDLLYQRGRILFARGDYEGALRVFAAFAESAPRSDLIPSALYWSGECLYALGRLDEADRAFAAVVEKYPSSVKVEAATYRRSLIGLEYRERELLKLLTWSHEEALRAVEDFRRREKAYDQSIALYQKQIADSKRGATTDQEKTLADLRAQVADLGSKLATAEAQLTTAQNELAALKSAQPTQGASATAPAPIAPQATGLETDARTQALAAKERALSLLDFYLEQLTKGGGK